MIKIRTYNFCKSLIINDLNYSFELFIVEIGLRYIPVTL